MATTERTESQPWKKGVAKNVVKVRYLHLWQGRLFFAGDAEKLSETWSLAWRPRRIDESTPREPQNQRSLSSIGSIIGKKLAPILE